MIDGVTLLPRSLPAQSLVDQIRLQLVQDLEVSKVCKLGQVQDGLVLDYLIALMVEHLHNTLSDEEHLLHWALVADDCPVLLEDSAEHADDELVDEATLTVVEEVVEAAFELLEHLCILDQVGLHFGRDLLVEWELFNDKIEIVEEGLFNV